MSRKRSPEELLVKKIAADLRQRALRRNIYGHSGTPADRHAILEDGDDPQFTVQRGSNRANFNLGEGARWRRSRHAAS